MESKLESALDDAWSKVNIALDKTEYSSLLFNLTYGLEDVKPTVKLRKGEAALVLVKDSIELLKRARERRNRSAADAYVDLRTAADFLKSAHLEQVRKSTKKRE